MHFCQHLGHRLNEALLDAGIGKDILGSFESGIQQPSLSVVAKMQMSVTKKNSWQ